MKTQQREAAYAAIMALKMPDEWDEFSPHLKYTGYRHRKSPGSAGMRFAALGTLPGTVEISCAGITIGARYELLGQAVAACLAWLAVVDTHRATRSP